MVIEVEAVPIEGISPLHAHYKNSRTQITQSLHQDVVPAFEAAMDCGERLLKLLAVGETRTYQIDPLADRCWGAFNQSCRCQERAFVESEFFSLIEEERTQRDLIQQVRLRFLGDDILFTKAPFLDQWRESDYRLARLDLPLAEGHPLTLRKAIQTLGWAVLLTRLIRIHEAYGRSLGITNLEKFRPLVQEWDKKFAHFMTGFAFKHSEPNEANDTLRTLVVEPYTRLLEEFKERKRRLRTAPKEDKDNPDNPDNPDDPAPTPQPS